MTSRTKEPLFGARVGKQSTGTIGVEEIPMTLRATKTALSSTNSAGSGMTDRVTRGSDLSVKKISIRI